MRAKPRVVLLAGDGLRHRYAASLLAGSLDLAGVVTEQKGPAISTEFPASAEDREIMGRHLVERDGVERELLGQVPRLPDVPELKLARGGVNGPECAAWVQRLAPDAVLLFGTGIVAQPLLAAFENRVINLHLGLSPYYRGAATNFWPLVNREPECVGVTIHLAVGKVDAGDILAQVRPRLEAEDGPHQVGTKALIAGLKLFVAVVPPYLDGRRVPQAQDLSLGRVYRRRDFTAAAVLRVQQNLRERMMDQYIRHASARCAVYPIVEFGPEPAGLGVQS